MSALKKGTGFELKIAELFKQNGYAVTHNIKMQGKSGAEHQIDVLAEFTAPLHTSSVIIEAKSYQKNIDKDIIMKLIQIQQDVSADRAILATTSAFTPGAISTANQYKNVELWDGEKISKHLGKIQLMDTADVMTESQITSKKMLESKISEVEVQSIAQETIHKRAKGGFMGKGKIQEEIIGIKKFLYPYYDLDMDAQIKIEEKTGWMSTEESIQNISSRTGADAITGALIDVDDQGIFYYYSYLSDLDEDELILLHYVSNIKEFEKRSLSAIGWSAGKITKIVNSLSGKGVLEQTNTRPVTFGKLFEYPNELHKFRSMMEEFQVVEFDSIVQTFEPQISPASIQTAFGKYWPGCNVKSIDTVYYPYYAVVYGKKDGNKRIEVIDGISGKKQKYLEKIITPSVLD